MGTLSGGSASLTPFDGQVQHWQAFKDNGCRLCDEKDWTWLIEDVNVISYHLQVTVATMTVTTKRAPGGMSTDFSKFSREGINEVANKLKNGRQGPQDVVDSSRHYLGTFVVQVRGYDWLINDRFIEDFGILVGSVTDGTRLESHFKRVLSLSTDSLFSCVPIYVKVSSASEKKRYRPPSRWR